MQISKIRLIVLGMLLVTASARGALVHTDLTTFLGQVQPGYYLETFDAIPLGEIASPMGFSSGGYSYSAAATDSYLWGLNVPGGSGTDRALSTNTYTAALVFTFTSGNVTAVGGYFFPTDFGGGLVPGSVVLTLSDGTTYTLIDGTPASFVGFTTGPGLWINSLTVDSPDSPSQLWPTVNDLYVGQTSDEIPEPATGALLAGGVLLLVALARRRTRSAA